MLAIFEFLWSPFGPLGSDFDFQNTTIYNSRLIQITATKSHGVLDHPNLIRLAAPLFHKNASLTKSPSDPPLVWCLAYPQFSEKRSPLTSKLHFKNSFYLSISEHVDNNVHNDKSIATGEIVRNLVSF
jgi:hypothetical protein